MNLSLTEIEVEDFKNFAGRHVLRVGDLAPGLHFVRGVNLANPRLGPNGVGKSTLVADAPCWCLTGKTVKGRPTTAVRPWRSKKQPRVALTLACDGAERVVVRGPRATDLTLDGATVGQGDVDRLVGLDHALLTQSVVFGQGRPLFFDLAPRDKMQLLSDAMGLERWERRADAAAKRARRLQDALAGVRGELAGLETARGHAQEALEEARGASERWAGERAQKVEGLAHAARAARARADSLEVRRGEASVAADKAGLAAKLLRPDVEAAQEALGKLRQEARDHERQIQQLSDQLTDNMAQERTFAETGTCPTCGQTVGKKDADKHIRRLRARGDELEGQCDAAGKEAVARNKKISALTSTTQRDEAALAKLEDQLCAAADEQRSLDRELAAARAEAAAAERARTDAEEETNPHREASAAARARLREIKAETAEKDDRATKLEASAERAQFWARGFRDIRLMVIDDLLADLQETTAAMLEDLGLGEWEVRYTTERETGAGTTQRALHVEVTSPTSGEPQHWEDWSGGEGQRLRVAGALALSEVLLAHAGVGVDFRVLDEPTRGLSREGVRDLCDMLAAYAEEAGLRLFFVDHHANEGAVFASSITVVCDKSGARIEEG
jgi:Herelleviridae exonuclease